MKWKKVKGALNSDHELVLDGVVVAIVRKSPDHQPPSGSYTVWEVVGRKGSQPTLRDAKESAERAFAIRE